MISSSAMCDLSICESQEMLNKFNGEVFAIVLNIQPSIELILEVS